MSNRYMVVQNLPLAASLLLYNLFYFTYFHHIFTEHSDDHWGIDETELVALIHLIRRFEEIYATNDTQTFTGFCHQTYTPEIVSSGKGSFCTKIEDILTDQYASLLIKANSSMLKSYKEVVGMMHQRQNQQNLVCLNINRLINNSRLSSKTRMSLEEVHQTKNSTLISHR